MDRDYEKAYKAVLKTAQQWIKDERIRKFLLRLAERCNENSIDFMGDIKKTDVLAWLEKQKEQDWDIVPELRPTACGEGYQHGCKDTEEKYSGMMVCSPEEWNEAISDAFKHGMDEGEKQKEQKPAEHLPKEKVYAIMTKLTELSASNLIPINSPEYLKIHQITKDVRSLLDYPIEQKPVEWNANDKAFIKDCAHILDENGYAASAERLLSMFPIKPAEWSEEDERILKGIIGKIDHDQAYGVSKVEMLSFLKSLHPQPKQEWSDKDTEMYINVASSLRGYACGLENEEHKRHIKKGLDWFENRFKSLRPSWKPSEEQMKALQWWSELPSCSPGLKSLYEDLKKLI